MTPRMIPKPRLTTIIMGSTVICRAQYTAPRPCHWSMWLATFSHLIGLAVFIVLGVTQCEHKIMANSETTRKGFYREWDKSKGPITTSITVNAAMTLSILVSLKTRRTNRDTPEWGCNPFWRDFIVFNKITIAKHHRTHDSASTITLSVNGSQRQRIGTGTVQVPVWRRRRNIM